MFKQIVFLVVMTLLVILGIVYVQQGLQYLVAAHDWIDETLKQVFTDGQAGAICRQFISMLAIPLLVGLVPAAIYGLLRRQWFPYFMQFVWVTWLLEVGALVMVYKAAAAV